MVYAVFEVTIEVIGSLRNVHKVFVRCERRFVQRDKGQYPPGVFQVITLVEHLLELRHFNFHISERGVGQVYEAAADPFENRKVLETADLDIHNNRDL